MTRGPGDQDSRLRSRLRQVAAQVLDVERMLGEERSCADVLARIGAARGALRAAGEQILACHLAGAARATLDDLPALAAAERAAAVAGLRAAPAWRTEKPMRASLQEASGTVQAAEPVLAATGLEKGFRRGVWPVRRGVAVLRGVDLVLRPGEVVVLVGENGSGKSTLMKILVGAIAPDAGTVTAAGRIGYCPQEAVVYERLTCDEHFELFGSAYRMSAEAERRSRRALYAALGFERYAGTRADQLSGGTLAKLNLGIALLADPEVLLLDEPYAGFDWDTYVRFWDLVAQRRAAGRAVLIISHFVADEERFDRIVHLRGGKAEPR